MPSDALAQLARVLRITPETFEEAVEAAADVLHRGGVVALPTDTIYGVSTLMQHSNKLYSLKRRPAEKPLGLFLSDPAEIPQWARITISPNVIQQLLPGPVTLIFNRLPSLPTCFNPGKQGVGFRVPDSLLIQALTTRIGQPLAQTSANVSGSSVDPTCIDDFFNLFNEIDVVLDGGAIRKSPREAPPYSLGSTIIDLTQDDYYRVVREGCVLKRTERILRAAGIRPLQDMKRKAEPDAEEMTSSKGPSTSKKLAPDANNDFINETELQKSIQVSVLKSADDVCEEIGKQGDRVHFNPSVLAHVGVLIWDIVSDDWTSDLLLFSRHAGREAVNVSDVVLIMRRNHHLLEMLSTSTGIDIVKCERPVATKQRIDKKELVKGKSAMKKGSSRPDARLHTTVSPSPDAGVRLSSSPFNVIKSETRIAERDLSRDIDQDDIEGDAEGNLTTGKHSKNLCEERFSLTTDHSVAYDGTQKSHSPDLFNTPVKGSGQFDQYETFEPPAAGGSLRRFNVDKTISKGCDITTKKSKGGWSAKFSEFSFFDDVVSEAQQQKVFEGDSEVKGGCSLSITPRPKSGPGSRKTRFHRRISSATSKSFSPSEGISGGASNPNRVMSRSTLSSPSFDDDFFDL